MVRKTLMLALLGLGLTFVSCKDDNDEPTVTPEEALPSDEPTVTPAEALPSKVEGTLSLDASKEYKLAGPLLVGDGCTLNIPAGTVIKAAEGFDKYILVLQGGKINIEGTAEKPVRIRADKDGAGSGYWGGLVINGKAKLSGDWDAGVPDGKTEISNEYKYGGNEDADSSGKITYLILENTGAKSSADVEHNGLTLNGVGSGTIIENVFVNECADDGIEFFGGSVNVKNLLCVNTDDDMFDVTQGWTGTLDNAYGVWQGNYISTEKDPRGVEADGNLDGKTPTDKNQSNFTLKNITIWTNIPYADEDGKTMKEAIKIRRGATATLDNVLVKGTGKVVNVVDTVDKNGDGLVSGNVTKQLENLKGSDLNKKEDNTSEISFVDGNKGADTSVFGWTGFKF